MSNKDPMTMKEFAEMFYDPERTDPQARVTRFNVTLDMGDYTRRVTWKKGDDFRTINETAKRGKCIARAQGLKP